MKGLLIKALSLGLLFGAVMLHGCGHGGTEVGNPPGPQIPGVGAGAPGFDDQENATPSPSPGANLILEETGDENEIALNPEENES